MVGKTGEENRENGENSEKNLEFYELIKNYKEDKDLSYTDLAQKIYYKFNPVTDENENTLDNEEELIRKIGENIKKAINNKRNSTIKMGEKKISFRKMCDILNINHKKPPIPKELPGKENYIQMNKAIIDGKTGDWKEWEEKCFDEVKNASEQGFKEAQTTLAHYYFYHGENGFRDVPKAIELYKKAAQQNDELAQYQLGCIYEYGDENITINITQAYKYYESSANFGFPLAFNKLAFFYYSGTGVHKNIDKFVEYAQKAEEHNDILGTLYLAFAYSNGIGVNKDIDKAIRLYEKIVNDKNALPHLQDIFFSLISLYYEKGDTQKATDYLEKYIKWWTKDIREKLGVDGFIKMMKKLFQLPLSPEKNNELLKSFRYDYIHNPAKSTIVKALFTE